MRVRSFVAVGLSVWTGAMFWACGDASFNGEGTDDGGNVSDGGNGNDGSSNEDGSSGDGSVGDEGGSGGDGGVSACVPPSIAPLDAGVVDCLGSACTTEGVLNCCISEGTSTCVATSCAGTTWDCEKSSDCPTQSSCCLHGAMTNSMTCPPSVIIGPSTSSTCNVAAAACGTGMKLCAADQECGMGLSCKTFFVDFGGDAGTLVGICSPP